MIPGIDGGDGGYDESVRGAECDMHHVGRGGSSVRGRPCLPSPQRRADYAQTDWSPVESFLFLAGPGPRSGLRWDLSRPVARELRMRDKMQAKMMSLSLSLCPGTQMSNIEASLWREKEKLREETDARCIKMLEQALSGSERADVEFVFGEGGGQQGSVRGHWGMLCAGSETFDAMFRSGMSEAKERKIRVPPGVEVASFRGFLEWIYLGGLDLALSPSMRGHDDCVVV